VRINALAGTRANHVSAAAHGAVIIIITTTTTADHPFRGDAWVMRGTARRGTVVQCRRCCPAAGMTGPYERGQDVAIRVICQARLEPQSDRRIKMPEVGRSGDG